MNGDFNEIPVYLVYLDVYLEVSNRLVSWFVSYLGDLRALLLKGLQSIY